jgi:hypothetical protein
MVVLVLKDNQLSLVVNANFDSLPLGHSHRPIKCGRRVHKCPTVLV